MCTGEDDGGEGIKGGRIWVLRNVGGIHSFVLRVFG